MRWLPYSFFWVFYLPILLGFWWAVLLSNNILLGWLMAVSATTYVLNLYLLVSFVWATNDWKWKQNHHCSKLRPIVWSCALWCQICYLLIDVVDNGCGFEFFKSTLIFTNICSLIVDWGTFFTALTSSTIDFFQRMAPCYVVFNGKKPGIYFTWYECAKLVLGQKGVIYQKYSKYDDALRDFNARIPEEPLLLPVDAPHGEASASHQLVTAQSLETYPNTPLLQGCCKNAVILILILLVVGLSVKLFMCHKCCF